MTDTRDKLAAELFDSAFPGERENDPYWFEAYEQDWYAQADALLASDVLRDMLNEAEARGRAEVAATERERDRLREWKAEATQLFDGLQDLGRALDLPLGVLVTGPIAIKAANALREERDAALADRGALRLTGSSGTGARDDAV